MRYRADEVYADLVAGPSGDPFAKQRQDVLTHEYGDDMGFRACRVNRQYLGFGASIVQPEVFRTTAQRHGEPIGNIEMANGDASSLFGRSPSRVSCR